MIRRDTTIKDIVCIACGAPIWGTFEEAARNEGYDDREIDEMVAELNALRDAPA